MSIRRESLVFYQFKQMIAETVVKIWMELTPKTRDDDENTFVITRDKSYLQETMRCLTAVATEF